MDYDDICRRVDKINKCLIEFMKTQKPDDLTDGNPEKRCGTCRNYSDVGCACMKGWRWEKRSTLSVGGYYKAMQKEDRTNCRDWQGKPKEKKRVWVCVNCGQDIFFRPEYYKIKQESNKYKNIYQHLNGLASCIEGHQNLSSSDLLKVAIPKPDSERWIEE